MASKETESPVKQELTGNISFSDFIGSMPNPDIVLRNAGISVSVYNEMLHDPQIYSAFQKRKRKIQQLKYSIDGEDKEVVDFIAHVFSNLNMAMILAGMLKALPFGYSIAELMWEEIDGKWMVTDVLNRGNDRFSFNDKGELTFTSEYDAIGKVAPYGKFLVHRNDWDDTDNPYGTSLNSRCYWYWRFKKHGWKVWGLYLEKYGDPALVLKSSEQNAEKITALLTKLDSVASGSNIVIGEDETLDSLSASGASTVGYSDFVKESDKQITKVYLGSSVLMDDSATGNYSTAEVHGSDLDDIIMSDADAIANTLRFDIIKPLIEFNFGKDREVPFIKFFKNVVLDNETQTVVKDDDEEKDIIEEKTEEIKIDNEKTEAEEEIVKEDTSFFFGELNEEQFANLPLHKQTIEALSGNLGASQINIMTKNMDFSKFYESPQYAQKEMNALFHKMSEEMSEKIGYALFYTAMYAKMATPDYRVKFSKENFASKIIEDGVILPYDRAREFFSDKVRVSDDVFRTMVGNAKTEAFSIADIKSNTILSEIQNSISRAIENGMGEYEWKSVGDRILKSFGASPLSSSHLANVYRTNLYSAYARAGYEEWEKVSKDFPAFMYDAVGDNRTRPAHLALDGKIFYADDPFWKTHYPPNGYNCRCSVIPMSKKKLVGKTVSNGKDFGGTGFAPDDGWDYHGGKGTRSYVPLPDVTKASNQYNYKDYGLDANYDGKKLDGLVKPIDFSKNSDITKLTENLTVKDKMGANVLFPKGSYKNIDVAKDIVANPDEIWYSGGVKSHTKTPSGVYTYVKTYDIDGKSVVYQVDLDGYKQFVDMKGGVVSDRVGIPLFPQLDIIKSQYTDIADDYWDSITEWTQSSDTARDVRQLYYGNSTVADSKLASGIKKDFDDMFTRATGDNNGAILYRGLNEADTAYDRFVVPIKDNDGMIDIAPSSWTQSYKEAIEFSKDVNPKSSIILEVKGVYNEGYDITNFSSVEKEIEVLLLPNTRLQYVGTRTSGNNTIVELKVY